MFKIQQSALISNNKHSFSSALWTCCWKRISRFLAMCRHALKFRWIAPAASPSDVDQTDFNILSVGPWSEIGLFMSWEISSDKIECSEVSVRHLAAPPQTSSCKASRALGPWDSCARGWRYAWRPIAALRPSLTLLLADEGSDDRP
jgi:hypothetical protein